MRSVSMFISNRTVFYAADGDAKTALALLERRMKRNFDIKPQTAANRETADIILERDDRMQNKDSFRIVSDGAGLILKAYGVRGLIYASGMLLRSLERSAGGAELVRDIAGEYSPHKAVRGHQLGYRTLPNTYDAWSLDNYREYIEDIMLFGANTVEDTIYIDVPQNRNALMKYSQEELLAGLSDICEEYDIDLSLWYPNYDGESADDGAACHEKIFRSVRRLNYYFPPGGDPGRLPAREFIERTKKYSRILKSIHPEAKVYPSAQSPEGPFGEWAETFMREMNKCPEEIDGVVTGPNWAYPIELLRELLPERYPIRFYPDITHNLRCEHPVPNWHFALANALSRESCNPRMSFYRELHKEVDPYCIGSVSYSEGVHDDINKMYWGALDYSGDADIPEFAREYARTFIARGKTEEYARFILDMERAWDSDPVENDHIDSAFDFISAETKDGNDFGGNWRLALMYFKAACDKYIRLRRSFDLDLIREALPSIVSGDTSTALTVLNREYINEIKDLRQSVDKTAQLLFNYIGIQLDVEHYHADGVERGAVLDTIGNPVTDRQWLLRHLDEAPVLSDAPDGQFLIPSLDYEYYFSFAGKDAAGVLEEQTPYYYMDIQGDRERFRDCLIPMRMSAVYDHFDFRLDIGRLDPSADHELRLNILTQYSNKVDSFKITVNGHVIYCGPQYGGRTDPEFDRLYGAPGFETHIYKIPGSCLNNNGSRLEISEPVLGVRIGELAVTGQK